MSNDVHGADSGKERASASGDSRAEVAGTPHGITAADAAAYLERSGAAVEGLSGISEEIDRQAACLIRWAKAKGLILPASYTSGLLRHQSTTAEHEVFYRASDNRAVKCTYAGTFGVTPDPKGAQRAATPLFYLSRIELMNLVFRSDLRFEGVMLGKSLLIGARGEQASIVVSQPWIPQGEPGRPHPSTEEVDEFMCSLGFQVLRRSYFGWKREKDAIVVLDARPDNFIKSAEGVVPIDLVISQAK